MLLAPPFVGVRPRFLDPSNQAKDWQNPIELFSWLPSCNQPNAGQVSPGSIPARLQAACSLLRACYHVLSFWLQGGVDASAGGSWVVGSCRSFLDNSPSGIRRFRRPSSWRAEAGARKGVRRNRANGGGVRWVCRRNRGLKVAKEGGTNVGTRQNRDV